MSEMMQAYAAIGVTIVLVVVTAAGMLIAAHAIGPKRRGPVKDSAYESGMPPINDTRRRFNIRFYIVAMLFMLFDVEVVFLWPWALLYHKTATSGATVQLASGEVYGAGFLLAGMGIFFSLLLFGLVYEWKKGAFEWD